jgi:hypothetical protein
MEIRPESLLLLIVLVVLVTYLLTHEDQPTYNSCPIQRPVVIRDNRNTNNGGSNSSNNNAQRNGMSNSTRSYDHRTIADTRANNRQISDNPMDRIPPSEQRPTNVNIDIRDRTIVDPSVGGPAMVDPLREYDYRAYHDKLTPPRQRNIHEPEYMNPALAPIYTRGLPKPFRKVGTLTVTDGDEQEYRFLNLIGSKLPSGQYSYYAVSTRSDDNIKFDITTRKEIYDQDEVTVDGLNKKYTVKMDKNALPLYVGVL